MRDYYLPTSKHRTTVLHDYVGDVDGSTFSYRIGNRIVRANNDLVGSITGLPGQFRDNWRLLSDANERRYLARALLDDNYLTGRRRKAILSMILWGLLFVWLTVGFIVASVNQDAYTSYQSGWWLFFVSVATSLVLPLPFEAVLSDTAAVIGTVTTVLIAAIGKTLGTWMMLLLGDKANEGAQALIEKHAPLRKAFNAMETFAHKYGYFAIGLIFSIPGMTDTAPLLVLATLRMKKIPFLAVTFVAIIIRSLLWLNLEEFFSNLFFLAPFL